MDKKNLNREWLLRMAERLMKKKKIVIPAALIFIAAAAFRIRKRREETGRKACRYGSADERDGRISGTSCHRKH